MDVESLLHRSWSQLDQTGGVLKAIPSHATAELLHHGDQVILEAVWSGYKPQLPTPLGTSGMPYRTQPALPLSCGAGWTQFLHGSGWWHCPPGKCVPGPPAWVHGGSFTLHRGKGIGKGLSGRNMVEVTRDVSKAVNFGI